MKIKFKKLKINQNQRKSIKKIIAEQVEAVEAVEVVEDIEDIKPKPKRKPTKQIIVEYLKPPEPVI